MIAHGLTKIFQSNTPSTGGEIIIFSGYESASLRDLSDTPLGVTNFPTGGWIDAGNAKEAKRFFPSDVK